MVDASTSSKKRNLVSPEPGPVATILPIDCSKNLTLRARDETCPGSKPC